eukprot:tig00000076_g2408.t1
MARVEAAGRQRGTQPAPFAGNRSRRLAFTGTKEPAAPAAPANAPSTSAPPSATEPPKKENPVLDKLKTLFDPRAAREAAKARRKPPPEALFKIADSAPPAVLGLWKAVDRITAAVPGSSFIVDMSAYGAITGGLEKLFGIPWITGGLFAGAVLGAAKPAFGSASEVVENALLSRIDPAAPPEQYRQVVRKPQFCGPEVTSHGKQMPDLSGDDKTVRCLIHGKRNVGMVVDRTKGQEQFGPVYPKLLDVADRVGLRSIESGPYRILYAPGHATAARKIQRALATAAGNKTHDWVVGTLLGYSERDIKAFYKQEVPYTAELSKQKGGRRLFEEEYLKVVAEGKEWLDRN